MQVNNREQSLDDVQELQASGVCIVIITKVWKKNLREKLYESKFFFLLFRYQLNSGLPTAPHFGVYYTN